MEYFESIFLNVLIWFLLLELLSWAVAPVIALILPGMPDRGFGLSKTFGCLMLAFIVWFGASLKFFGATPGAAWVVLIVILLSGYATALYALGGMRRFIGLIREHAGAVELLFFSLAAFFLFCRFLTPEIFWGEKPMEFTFLNYFIRLESLPPQDPWSAGQAMRYYYFGAFLVSVLHKLGGIDPAVGFNLAIATLPALLVCGLYSIFLWLRPKRSFAVIASLGLTFLTNIEVLRLALAGKKINFDLFWASTRGFASPCFAEYPLWAFLFADLHAHVIAIPFTLLLLGLSTRLCLGCDGQSGWNRCLYGFLFGVCWGVLFPMNTWDFLTYGLFAGLLCLMNLLRRRADGDWYGNAFVPWFWQMFSVALGGAAAILPFMQGSAEGLEAHYGWVGSGEFNEFSQVFMHLGQWLVLAGAGLLLYSIRRMRSMGIGRVRALLFAVLCALIPLVFACGSPASGAKDFPWSVAACSALLVFLAVSGLADRPLHKEANSEAGVFIGLAVFVAAVLLSLAEFGYLLDRMNTVFKSYNAIWYLFGIGTFFVMPDLWTALWRKSGERMVWLGRFVALIVPLFVSAALAGSILDVWIMTRDRKVEGPRPTLNGNAYLYRTNPNEAGLIDWINQNVKGLPVVLEAWGDSYREFTRISMHTGLPTVAGWEHHIKQRGTPEREVAIRKADIRRIYTASDMKLIQDLLRRYNIELIVVGRIEIERYTALNLRKFENHPELFPVLYRQGDTTLYGVRFEP